MAIDKTESLRGVYEWMARSVQRLSGTGRGVRAPWHDRGSVGPPEPPAACQDCLDEGTTWVELRRCLMCGRNSCYESSPRRHTVRHFERTGHPVVANQSGGAPWGWCFVDGLAPFPDES
jgi:hypothetical protein